jgi:uncharacterized protein (DUF488 family)
VVADTRSQPRSKFAPHFDRSPLKHALSRSGIRYVYLGSELGGRPADESFYDTDGRVLYSKVAATPTFQDGVVRLEQGIRKFNVAILCAEEDPSTCHRRILVGRVLENRGITVAHIRANGSVQSERDLASNLIGARDDQQAALFPDSEAEEWKSIPLVLRKRRQSNSSSF